MPPRETLNLGGWETQPSSCLGPRSPSPPSTHLRPGLRSQAAPGLPACKPSPPRDRDKQLRPRRDYAAGNSRPHRPGPREKAHKLDRAEAEPPAHHVTATSLLPLTQRELRDAPSESLGRQGVGAREPHQFTTRAANSRALASHDQHSHSAHRLALPSPAKKMPSHLAPDSCTPPRGRWQGTHATLAPLPSSGYAGTRLAIPLPPKWPSRAGPSPHSHWLSGV